MGGGCRGLGCCAETMAGCCGAFRRHRRPQDSTANDFDALCKRKRTMIMSKGTSRPIAYDTLSIKC